MNRSVSDTPKFYKEDLLSLLQDKQEMKEEVIALREETTFLKRLVDLHPPPPPPPPSPWRGGSE